MIDYDRALPGCSSKEQKMAGTFTATAMIKLVIWDLDDTFWDGTLSEGGVRLVDRNIEIVKELADRGIMSSIASKNDLEPVRQVLTKGSVWDYFIFPKVCWSPKGSLINEIVEQANLRPDNVLFIDDNPINIEEARFRFPTMMVAHPQAVLPSLLDLPQAKGKDDRGHSRLKQYKQLEKKLIDQGQSALSNVEFLRQCEIKLRFEFDVEQHIDRIIELINRSNQLNYTKVRLETDDAVLEFKNALKRHDIFAAGIFASDRYGSHGLIGFYMQQRNERTNRLLHYVWSCRMMNAGLEQYVYDRLGKPVVDVVAPVSNPIMVFDKVDWVSETHSGKDEVVQNAPLLLLIGSCDLTAVASYCSQNRHEYVNGVKHGVMTRYDDFGFILGDRERIIASKNLNQIPSWDREEFTAFHQSLATSEILIVSLSAAMKGVHLVTEDGVVLRVHPEGLGHEIDFNPRAGFLRGSTFYAHSIEQKVDLLIRSLSLMEEASLRSSQKFLLGANTRDIGGVLSQADHVLLSHYNTACRTFCENTENWHFVSIDEVVALEKLVDDRHYTRMGYLDIANHINGKIRDLGMHASREKAEKLPPKAAEGKTLISLIRAGRTVSRMSSFGSQKAGTISYIKQAVKMTPLSGVLRKLLAKEGNRSRRESDTSPDGVRQVSRINPA